MVERERRPAHWLLVRSYADPNASIRAYETTRDLLFTLDLEASTFRFLFQETWHVGVLGDEPLTPTGREQVDGALDTGGSPAELLAFVEQELRRRRRGFKRTGYRFFERRGGGSP